MTPGVALGVAVAVYAALLTDPLASVQPAEGMSDPPRERLSPEVIASAHGALVDLGWNPDLAPSSFLRRQIENLRTRLNTAVSMVPRGSARTPQQLRHELRVAW